MEKLFDLVRIFSLTDTPTREEKITNILNTLFLLLQDYRRENGIGEHKASAQEELFARFFHAITQYYTKNREVRFYAELFHLSPKYFASVIKRHTNINALEWINGYVFIQAKILLRYHKQLTVQEVSLRLGFVDQATFSRFFKSRSGMSPSDYRDMAF